MNSRDKEIFLAGFEAGLNAGETFATKTETKKAETEETKPIRRRKRRKGGSPWTKESKARLKELHAEGVATRDLAVYFNKSKQAIDGMLLRMGLKRPATIKTETPESIFN